MENKISGDAPTQRRKIIIRNNKFFFSLFSNQLTSLRNALYIIRLFSRAINERPAPFLKLHANPGTSRRVILIASSEAEEEGDRRARAPNFVFPAPPFRVFLFFFFFSFPPSPRQQRIRSFLIVKAMHAKCQLFSPLRSG